jgi:hypothetical protein
MYNFKNIISAKSLELAYKDNRCYFLHTYGNILKEQFLHLRDKKLKKQPNNKVPAAAAVPLLRLILGALEHIKANLSFKNCKCFFPPTFHFFQQRFNIIEELKTRNLEI